MLIDGIKTNSVYYMAADSLFTENKHWDELNKTDFGEELRQG